MRTLTVVETKPQSYADEKKQIIKELLALMLTYPEHRKTPRTYIKNAIRFIEQE